MRLFGSAFPVNPCTFAHVPLLEGSAERALQPGVCGCYQVSEMLFLNVYTYSDVSVTKAKGVFLAGERHNKQGGPPKITSWWNQYLGQTKMC